jgi:hypothetical protein
MKPATYLKHGARAACRYCEQDIEFTGITGWRDRGGNRACCPLIKAGEILRPKTKHAPFRSDLQ